eukprot:365810-Chlamydomonas_euryale.AAC.38
MSRQARGEERHVGGMTRVCVCLRRVGGDRATASVTNCDTHWTSNGAPDGAFGHALLHGMGRWFIPWDARQDTQDRDIGTLRHPRGERMGHSLVCWTLTGVLDTHWCARHPLGHWAVHWDTGPAPGTLGWQLGH